LFGSVMLIVAIAVGYMVRRDDLAHSRDVRIESDASVASAHVGGFIKAIELTAEVAADPEIAAAALSDAFNGAAVCVVGRAALSAEPACTTHDTVFAERATRLFGQTQRTIAASGGRLEITVVGSATGVHASVDLLDRSVVMGSVLEFAETADAPPPLATTVDGRRVAANLIEHGDGLWVSASTDDSVHIASDERLMVAVLSSLAVLLLVLAAMTMPAERRALLERATIDPLTRLPNRGEFERRAEIVLATSRRTDVGVCLLLFDLDGFKLINDTHGHQAGDEVLRVMGKRLRRAVRESDVVARWGGDEFVLMLPGIEDASSARSRASSLAELISRGEIDGLKVRASVGISLYPRHAETLTELIRAADAAMYAAKRDGVTHRLAGIESAPIEATVGPATDRRVTSHVR
jgi:diguanylate cyclase (GGDEF)-like protein